MLKFFVILALVAIGDANCAQTAAMIRSASYTISLQMRKNADESFGLCAGSILSKDWIVTAASCINHPENLKSYYILAGTDDRTRGGSIHGISRIVIHEDFDKTRTNEFVNDIALIKVKKSLVLDASRRAATVSDRILPAKDTRVSISGWGTSQTSGNIPKVLHILFEEIMSLERCKRFYENRLPEKQFCTSHIHYDHFIQDESGNPVVINGNLIGIGTWSSGSALPGRPDVFTDIFQYRDWIKSKMAQ